MKVQLAFWLLILPLIGMAQQPCRVLMPGLDSVYTGKCKKGLAHGAGEAWGKFYYKGRFADGYPNGQGRAEYADGSIYVGSWNNGQRHGRGALTTKLDGQAIEKQYLWEKDSILKEILPPPYKVVSQRNVSRMRVFMQGEGRSVWFFPNSTGGVSTDLTDIQMTGNSGKEVMATQKLGYEEVVFPFRGSIRYKAWNQLRTTQVEIQLEIEITQTGDWVVEIQN